MTDSLRQVIVDAHNERRNRLAKGQISGFEAAVRMPVMLWSGELSYLAELKAKQCLFQHDKCHNTARFKQTGQNMAYLMDWGKYGEAAPTINRFMKMWFDEYKTADMGIISEFRFADE
jgi:Cysteine-rich secretory protein family